MATLYRNFLSGVVDNAPLLSGGTTLNSTGLANMPAVSGGNTMWLVLDPEGTAGTPEIVQVTAHTGGATTATIVRGQQTSTGGGAARQHLQNTVWVQAFTVADIDEIIALSTALDGRLDTAEADIDVLSPSSASVATAESTSGGSFVDLATPGPAVTLTTGSFVRVTIVARRTAGGTVGEVGVEVSGATVIAAPAGIDATSADHFLSVPIGAAGGSKTEVIKVTPGSNTFTLKYRSGTGMTFADRYLIVERLD